MRRAAKQFGFTFVELMLGMVVTSLVVVALSALITAVARGWKQSDAVRARSNSSIQATLRVQKVLRMARQMGNTRAGSLDGSAAQAAGVMLWKGDANYDGKVQFSELAMIQHSIGSDAAHSKLLYYDVEFPSSWTTAQKQAADSTLADDDIYKSDEIDTFKNLNYVTSKALAQNIVGATFKRIDGSSVTRPALEFKVKIQKSDGTTDLEYGMTAVRTPATLPASQSGG